MNLIAKPTIASTLTWAIRELKNNTTSAALDAEVLLCFILKKEKAFLYTHPEKVLSRIQLSNFKKTITQRKKGVPVAYLTNHQEFYGFDFYVDKRVLIPRPETEQLIDIVNQYIKKSAKNLTIADIGTGSGCIAISLKKIQPNSKIITTDISASALAVAKKNAKMHRATILFKKGNLLAPLAKETIDIVAANLPYVPLSDQKKITLQNKGLAFEPKIALYAENNGLRLYQTVLNQIKTRTQKPTVLIFEHDPRHAQELQRITRSAGYTVKQIKDISGRNRFIAAELE